MNKIKQRKGKVQDKSNFIPKKNHINRTDNTNKPPLEKRGPLPQIFAIIGDNFKSFFYNVARMFFIGNNLKDDGSPSKHKLISCLVYSECLLQEQYLFYLSF